MKQVKPWPMPRRHFLFVLGLGAFSTPSSAQFFKGNSMNAYATEVLKWSMSFCSYGIDIDPKGQGDVTTLVINNYLKDAEGQVVSTFFTGFGAAWGAGNSGMSGPGKNGARLPKTLRMAYYDYLEDRFYRLDAELPTQRIYELFKQRTVDKDVNYGQVRGRFDELRIGVAPDGHVMLWASGIDQVELQTYRAQVQEGITRESYNASLPGGTFTLMEDRWAALKAGRIKPEALERIKAGWRPDPAWYMRHIRVKYPWRHRLTGNVSQLIELESYQGNAEAQTVGAWEMGLYQSTTAMRGIPKTAKFWFNDLAGKRHHVWVSFSLRERALSEKDLSEVQTAFEQMFGKRKLEDNNYMPGEQDMATVEVNIGDDFKTLTASLVKGDMRLPLPIGKRQHFALEPNTHWPAQRTEKMKPEVVKLFQYGPDA